MNSIKVLGINGSPRKDGKTRILIQTVLESARKNGAQTDIVHLVEHPVSYCMGCYSKDPILCDPEVFQQMLPQIYIKLLESDAFIFGTPVYWFGVSGLMKNFLDLLTALENKEKLLEYKVAGCVVSMEEDGAIQSASQILIPLNFMGIILPPYAITYALGALEKNKDTLFEAERIGENLVKFAKIMKYETQESRIKGL